MSCCVCGADDFEEGWQKWDDHPARKQWEVLKDLGAGALSQVVLARHKETGEMAALKVVFLESPTVQDDPEHLAIVQREADLLGMLDHPNLVECKDVIRTPKQLVLVLEWLRGGQVIDRLHELGLQYSEQQAAAIFVQVAEAVAHLHEYNVLHRDIKPENVMFAQTPAEAKQAPLTAAQLQAGKPRNQQLMAQKMPVVKVIDLGMACLYDPAKPVTGPLGSPGFVAPEIIAGERHTPAMDVFSLGVLLFIMLSGRKPFNIKESENLQYAFSSLTEAPGLKDPRWLDLSPDAKHLVMGMLAYDPARRLTMEQVVKHEWVVSRGGILPRPLGQDVVFGAATVASIRRLRNLCGGVVAFNRAAAAANGGKVGPVPTVDSAKDAYLRRLKQTQKLELSVRGGGAMRRMAANLASSAYARAHDAGGAINPADDVSVRRGTFGLAGAAAGGGSVRGAPPREGSSSGKLLAIVRRRGGSQGRLRTGSLADLRPADPSNSRRGRFGLLPGGMPRAGTTVMLSEMDRISREASIRGGSSNTKGGSGAALAAAAGGGGGSGSAVGLDSKLNRHPSTLQLLSAAAKVYLEGSVHGSRRGGSLAAAAAAAAANGSTRGGGANGSSRGARQVADDRSGRHYQQLLQQQRSPAQLQAVGDSSNSSSKSSGSGLGLGLGRMQSPLTAALAAGAALQKPAAATQAVGGGGSGGGGLVPPALPAASATVGSYAPAAVAAAAIDAAAAAAAAGAPEAAGAEQAAGSGRSSSRNSFSIDGLRPHVVVRRKSMDNPLNPPPPPPAAGRTWSDMQSHLRQQQQQKQRTPRSSSTSREGTGSSTPGVRVVKIKPLE